MISEARRSSVSMPGDTDMLPKFLIPPLSGEGPNSVRPAGLFQGLTDAAYEVLSTCLILGEGSGVLASVPLFRSHRSI